MHHQTKSPMCIYYKKKSNACFDVRCGDYSNQMKPEQIPKIGYVFDIDGTLTISKQVLPGATEILSRLQQQGKPFMVLTNNSGRSEQALAEQLSQTLQLKKPLQEEQVVLNYTPVKERVKQHAEDGIVLIVGNQNRLKDMLPLPFISRYVTAQQYATIFHQTSNFLNPPPCQPNNPTLVKVKERLGLTQLSKHTLKFSLIFMWTCPQRWQLSYQVMIDVLSTQQGSVSEDHHFRAPPTHIPVISAYGDVLGISPIHNLPRLLIGSFLEGFKAVHQAVYKQKIQIEVYGKPNQQVYKYSEQQITKMYGKVDRLVMIGDNQDSDLIGAKNAGWDTILVKTGVTKKDCDFATVNASTLPEGLDKYHDWVAKLDQQ